MFIFSYLYGMNFKQLSIILIIILSSILLNAQHIEVKDKFQKHEIEFLDIIYKDSTHSLNLILNSNLFNFGLNTKEFKNIALLKKGKAIWIQPLGSGKLFKLVQTKNEYHLIRIDSTIHSGVNYEAFTFLLHDTIFQFGGSGFWHLRGIMTYFSKTTQEWELYPSNILVNGYADYKDIIKYKIDTQANKLYANKSLVYRNLPNDFSLNTIDSCFEFDFNNHRWTTLGATNNELRKSLLSANFYHFDMGDIIIFQNALDFFWLNYKTNTYGRIKRFKNEQMKQTWLSLYTTKETYDDVQFNLGNTAYLIKLDPSKQLSFNTFNISVDDIDTNNFDYVYKIENSFAHFIYNDLLPFFTPNVSITILILFFIFFLIYRQRKKRVPQEVNAILNFHFFNSLNVVEKELVQVLYEQQLKGEEISPKQINKIIGVQQKDTLTQNKSRSDHFLKINQKFKLATQQDLPLIIKSRDSIDKRQYNYGLETRYLQELGKHFKA